MARLVGAIAGSVGRQARGWLSALSPGEVRRDVAALDARSFSVVPAGTVERAWREWPWETLDRAGCRGDSSDLDGFDRTLGGGAPLTILCGHRAVAEATRDARALGLPTRLLDRLGAGEGLRARRVLLLPFDEGRHRCLGWVGEASSVAALTGRVLALASAAIPALVSGETGTGKEIVARALHRLGDRADRAWVALNCAELSESLLESELFGHRRGAFTGASSDRAGLFVAAADGTIFLDEVAELTRGAQAKLLRVLEEQRVRAVGEDGGRPVACRVIAATNRDLAVEAADGRFRTDLYYRLRGATIALPPLRDAGTARVPLAAAFAQRAAFRLGRAFAGFTPSAERVLEAHSWPGNARELRQAVELAVLLAGRPWIRAEDFAFDAGSVTPRAAKITTIRELERSHLERALDATAGNRVAAARLLGLTRQSFDRRLERHGLLRPRAATRSSFERRDP